MRRTKLLASFAACCLLTGVQGIVAISATMVSPAAAATTATTVKDGAWTDPATWSSGAVPSAGTAVDVTRAVTCSGDNAVGGITIEAGASLTFDPQLGCTMRSSRNVVDMGTLVMQPASVDVRHDLQFVNINEANFVGGGMAVLASDVGLWVMEAGRLQLNGAPKTSWTNASGAIALGATSFTVASAAGWRVGDRIFIAPTQPPTAGDASFRGFDEGTITSVSGNTVTINTPTTYPHPVVHGQWTAEVGNLTRNVVIEGTTSGYSHVFVHSNQPQSVRYAELRYLAPQPKVPAQDGTGRYALHFHMSGDGSIGSVVQGVALHDTKNHAFVPHASMGVTFVDDLAYNVRNTAMWWDPKNITHQIPTNNTVIDHMLIARERQVVGSSGTRTSAFRMGFGAGNQLTNSVAVGLDAKNESAGFFWSDNEGSDGEWLFNNNVSHNSHEQGIFVWQNSTQPHVIQNFTAYYDTGKGIDHGSYFNLYTYRDITLYGNAGGGLLLRAVNSHTNLHPERILSFTNVKIDAAGMSDYAVIIGGHNFGGLTRPTPLVNFAMSGYALAAVQVQNTQLSKPDWVDFVNPTISGNGFWFDSGLDRQNLVRVLLGTKVLYALHPANFGGGTWVPLWNAKQSGR
jgi:hypothetical protein